MPKKDDPLKGLWLAVLLWLFGITAGFILLALVYTGPVFVRVIVFIVYLVVVFGTITSVRKLRPCILAR